MRVLVQAREESVQLATELACTKRQAATLTDELHLARDELARLAHTSEAAEAAVLQLQADAADSTAALAELQAERDSALLSLEKQGAQMQVRLLQGSICRATESGSSHRVWRFADTRILNSCAPSIGIAHTLVVQTNDAWAHAPQRWL